MRFGDELIAPFFTDHADCRKHHVIVITTFGTQQEMIKTFKIKFKCEIFDFS